jgi:class 3 adenylate cyclase
MGIIADLTQAVKHTLCVEKWTSRDGRTVPVSEDLGLGNDAVKLTGTVLYADLSGSTGMVDKFKPHFAAEAYKVFLHCAAKLIRAEGGEITAYDGDRIMAVFIGDRKNTSATRAALRINHAVTKIINPQLSTCYPTHGFQMKHVVGIDSSDLWVARTGVRGANDLVWVGRAANYAAKLTELSNTYATYITRTVYDNMHDSAKLSGTQNMWTELRWSAMGDITIYGSTWHWGIDG